MKANIIEEPGLLLYDTCKNIRGLSRFNLNINCEVNTDRVQTLTRKTVLVFQFFVKLFVARSPLLIPTSTR